MNTRRKPFDDANVRKAVNIAIDRWGGAAALGKISNYSIPGGVLRPGAPGATPANDLAKLPGFSRDMNAARGEARQLRQKAGVGEKLTFKLTTRNSETFVPVSLYLIDQWRRVGINVEVEATPVAQQKAKYIDGNFDATCAEVDEPKDLLINRPHQAYPLHA